MDKMDPAEWLNRTQQRHARITLEQANLMAATLGRTPSFRAGDPLPPAWHWLYFHEPTPAGDLGVDGHPSTGSFLPPVPLPRRMWAGGRFEFERPLKIDEDAVKTSTIKEITRKRGRTGELFFVVIQHDVSVQAEPCFREEQTLVYQQAATKTTQVEAPEAPDNEEFCRIYRPDPVLLFRYSALTFNGHRIHYDIDYCRDLEGYPGLVVHGPLVATLLLDLVRERYPAETMRSFCYRARSPLFLPHAFSVKCKREADEIAVWATNAEGGLAMEATARIGL